MITVYVEQCCVSCGTREREIGREIEGERWRRLKGKEKETD